MGNARERILDASTELFRRQGLTGTGIKQILTAANAPFGSLYHHFPGGKDQLAAETIARAGAYYAGVVFSKLASGPADDPAAAMRGAFLEAGRTLVDTGYADACPIETIALEVASTNETLREACADVFTSWLDGLTLWLEQVAGVPDGRALATTIIAALEGAFVLARAMRSTSPLEATADAMAELITAARREPVAGCDGSDVSGVAAAPGSGSPTRRRRGSPGRS